MKNKIINLSKYLLVPFICIYIFLSCNIMLFSAKADENVNEITSRERQVIENMIFQVAEQDGRSLDNMSYVMNDIYYSSEAWAGYVVDFTANNDLGYAIVFKIDDTYKLIELFFGKNSPYYNKEGLYIYPSLGYYYIKKNDCYYDANSLDAIPNYTPMSENIFYAACGNKDDDTTTVQRDINFIRGLLSQETISNFKCEYSTELSSKTNNCANAAGVIMLNYWNKKFNNDLLKLDSSEMAVTNMNDDTATIYMDKFYEYMNTNPFLGMGGTLPNDCYNGFKKLIEEKGYQVEIKKDLNYAEICQAIEQEIPIFITSTDYMFSVPPYKVYLPSVSMTYGNYTLSISYERRTGLANAHTFVGYGYAYYTLMDSNDQIFDEELIKVADGWGGTCYYNFTQGDNYSIASVEVYKV